MCGVSTTLGTVSRPGARWLALEDVEPGGGDAPLAQRLRQRRVVDDAAARDVGQRRGRLHLRQLGRADRVVRGGRIRHDEHQVVASRSSASLLDVARAELGSVAAASRERL
jgi:hypothetical protein